MPGRVLGDAIVVISPDSTGFRQLADAQLRKQMAGLKTNVTLGVDAKEVNAALSGVQTRLKALSSQLTDLRFNADTKQFEAKVAALQAKLAALTKQAIAISMSADTSKLDAQIVAEQAKLAGLRDKLANMKMGASTTGIDKSIASTSLKIGALQKQAANISLGAGIDPSKLLAVEAGLTGIDAAIEDLQRKAPDATRAMVDLSTDTANATTKAVFSWRILTSHIQLFGGVLSGVLPKALAQVAVWHLMLDGIIELTAVLVPASVAFAAFGVAGIKAGNDVYQRMLAINTVMNATGQTVPQLSSNFQRMSEAVRPEVYQLAGEALVYLSKSTGSFQTVAVATGHIVDQLGARFVYATTQGKGMSEFMKSAIVIAGNLGTLIGNIGGIFGNLFKAVPGYASILLSLAVSMTHVIEVFTQVAEPVIAAGLWLHGFIIYTGVAVTGTLALVGGLAKLIKGFITFAAASQVSGVGALKSFGSMLVTGGLAIAGWAQGILTAEGAAAKFSTALAPLALNPMAWVGIAAIALTGLVIAILRSKDAAQSFNETMQQTIQQAQLTSVVSTIQQAQTATAARLASTTKDLNQAIATNTTVNAGRAGGLSSNGAAISKLATASDEYKRSLESLSDQQQIVNSRFDSLSKQYGSNAAALGVLNLAGITTAQITDKNNEHWAQAEIQIEATTKAMGLMGGQAGALGNNLDVLGRTETSQYEATQKLNQGWQQFISDVTDTQNTFDTVEQGFDTLNSTSAKFTEGLGKLKVSGLDYVKSGIDQLTPSGIALNQAFSTQIGNVNTLLASWRTAGLADNLFTQGVKDAIAPMTKYAQGSQEATAQLIALAQQAGYQGPISMQALSKWLGNTSNATQNLKNITDQATAQEALLTGSMKDQGTYIANNLISDINNAILKYNGVEAAATAYGNAVARSGQQSDAAHNARQTLINDIIKSGEASKDSTGEIAAMISKVLGIPAQKAIQIVMKGTGSYSLSEINASTGKQQQAATGGYVNMAGRLMRAAGGYIQMGSGPTSDDVPIMASRGEFVVKASSVARYGKGMMDQINAGHYASGGLVNTGNTDVLSGQYAVTISDSFQTSFTKSFTAAMQKSLKSAETAALSAFQSSAVPNSGAGVQRWLGTVLQALALNGLPSSLANQVLYQIGTESGGNPNAINLTDSNAAAGDPSRGLLQTIGSTFDAYHVAGTSTNIYDPLANIAAAINYARHVYGPSLMRGGMGLGSGHGYALGGLIPGYADGGLIEAMAAGGAMPATHMITPAGSFAAGGAIPLAKYLPQLKAAQAGESGDYGGLRKAYLADIKGARTGSWTSGHKAGITSELATLAKRQSAEVAAYNAIIAHGTSKANLSSMGTKVKDVLTTSRDTDLRHSHPGWTSGLQYWLGVLTHLAGTSVAPAYGGTQAKLQFATWMAKAKTSQAHEAYDYTGLENSFKTGLSHARKGTWLYQNRVALGERLYAVATKQNAEAAAWSDLLKHSSGSVADLGGLAARISKLGGTVSATAGSLQPALLGHLPGGHPGWVKALQAQLKALTSLASVPPYNPPWAPGNLGASHTVSGGVLGFDRGGLLPPGLSMTYNGTGRPEVISPPGAGTGGVTVVLQNNGVIGSEAEVRNWLTRQLNNLARTGYLTQAVKTAMA
jgi:hypothetical protein